MINQGDNKTKNNEKQNEKQIDPNPEIVKLQEKYQDMENSYKRAVADYTNLTRRTEEEKEKIIKFANASLLKDILEILDDLEQSQTHIKDEGIDKIVEKFTKILSDYGVESFESENDNFDPNLHEAIESVDGPSGKIIKVHRKGYTMLGKVLRPALVAVGQS